MPLDEATPSLKPKKHAWYAACFVVVLLTIGVSLYEHLLSWTPQMERGQWIQYLGGFVGAILAGPVMMAPGLAFLLALLFFFDGRFVKFIVGLSLSAWTIFQAVELGSIIHGHLNRPKAVIASHPSGTLGSEDDLPRPSRTPSQRRERSVPQSRKASAAAARQKGD